MVKKCTKCFWSLMLEGTSSVYCCEPRAFVELRSKQPSGKGEKVPPLVEVARGAIKSCGPSGVWFRAWADELTYRTKEGVVPANRRPAPYKGRTT